MMSIVVAATLLPMVAMAEPDKAPAREAMKLTSSQEVQVSYEMRGFLVALQGINEALAKQDFAAVARYARMSGRSGPRETTPDLVKALPQQFREMAGETHVAFDQIATDAETMGDTRVTLEQISGIMKNCIQCHSVYRFGRH
jgi:mono/diheme cytochrome c family protein